jgi:hypothetical protein
MIINKEQICSINTYDFIKADSYVWQNYKPSKKSWLRKTKEIKEGVFALEITPRMIFSSRVHNWKNKFIVIDGSVRYKPHIDIKMSNNNIKTIYFNTIKERDTYINTNFNDRKYLIING